MTGRDQGSEIRSFRAGWTARMLATALVVGVASAGLPARAADNEGRFAVKGAARTLCKHFIRARDASKENPMAYHMYGAWLEGYVSAINERSATTYDLASFEGTELLSTLIYSNCKKNPDAKFFNLVRSLVQALEVTRLASYSELSEIESQVTDDQGKEHEVKVVVYRETLRRAQSRLKDLGHYQGGLDGQFGPKMRAAIKKFQADASLPVTGLPDQVTLLRLFRDT